MWRHRDYLRSHWLNNPDPFKKGTRKTANLPWEPPTKLKEREAGNSPNLPEKAVFQAPQMRWKIVPVPSLKIDCNKVMVDGKNVMRKTKVKMIMKVTCSYL